MCGKKNGLGNVDDDTETEENVEILLEVHDLDSESESGSGNDIDDNDSEDSDSDESDAEEEEEDDVVKSIIQENKKENVHPPTIVCDDFIVDISFHPTADLLAVGLITGDVALYKYSNTLNELVNTFEVHTKACRGVEFSNDGEILYSASKDKGIMLTDVETGKFCRFYDNAHESPIYSISVLDEHLFATGDDDGVLKLWDLREKEQAIFKIKKNEDYISDIITNDAQKYLLFTSGDGSLTTVDLQQRQFLMQSEEYKEELTCMGLFKQDTKLVVGTTKGRFLLFNWHLFGLHSDIFPGPKFQINSLLPITENIVVAAYGDGNIRATHLFPHHHLGVVGQHDLPVEKLDICNDGKIIASTSHNNDIKFWNIEFFENFEKNMLKPNKGNKKREMDHNLPSSKRQNVGNFFSDLA